ncbi:hypothetical protein C481_01080 [Natrialba asiatica DSM 12278]|uniref:Uncharacterized protein n=1 Tax=Natrialba asiatica (strain ATCC 700177 / DSM 12278 / JCM 9576 / FERM P-10747 / NBRC 102637 / 172P1) TaxID=29540 RepID=M0B6F4_NATA1|nr:hypothetical protein C481_01080 [Natrialba asiatica DSM 12278]
MTTNTSTGICRLSRDRGDRSRSAGSDAGRRVALSRQFDVHPLFVRDERPDDNLESKIGTTITITERD